MKPEDRILRFSLEFLVASIIFGIVAVLCQKAYNLSATTATCFFIVCVAAMLGYSAWTDRNPPKSK